MSKAILTLPMMPVDGTNYGKYVTPIVCETLKKIYDGSYYHCVNLLDSFNDRELNLQKYVDSLTENNINYDKLWYDKYNVDKLLENINTLIKEGYISEVYSNIYRCDCGVVEIEEHKINSCNPNNLKFEYKDSNMYCKECHGTCKKYNEKILIFSPKKIKKEQILFLPNYLNKDANTYINTVLDSYTTISRKRDTGIYLNYNGTKYNIDIDFLWATYLANFTEDEKIVVSGNRMAYQLFLVGVIEKCLNPNSKTILLGTPYLTNIRDITKDNNFIEDEIFRKLVILFNIKWSKKEKNYDETILTYLKNMGVNKRNQLYEIICNPIKTECDFFAETEYVLKRQLNMQECIKKLKMERGK